THKKNIDTIRKISDRLEKPVGVLMDLSGPKIRTGDFVGGKVHLKKGAKITLTTKKIMGDASKIYISYKRLPKEVKRGSYILLDDGRRKLRVINVSKDEVLCRIITVGVIKDRRGVNLPGVDLKISSLTTKDKNDVVFGVKQNVDYFALSFVRSENDVKQLRKLLNKYDSHAGIVAKVETKQAVKNIDAILEEADGIMVARGDLAVEVSREEVPLIQKDIIQKCNIAGKPVIIATQMLESMIISPVPTRAEVSDVANSILDGADAIMLSQETAFGKYPYEAVQIMSDVARKIEDHYPHREKILNDGKLSKELEEKAVVDAITTATVRVAGHVNARVIVALTESGFTPRMVSRYRPTQPILALSRHDEVVQKMTLYYGCYSRKISDFEYVLEVLDEVRNILTKVKLAKKGDTMVIAAGVPMGKGGST
ncbi:MAG: pyruvate kinase, partial [Candidatus Pacebacteria bacterium]|nr:pyruvate kinase [Candidatus Paceibacterota bacterium]